MNARSINHTARILYLLSRATPELVPSITKIVTQVNPIFIEEGDFQGFHFGTLYNRIAFNDRAIRVKWLIGHSAWHAIEHYSGALAYWVTTGSPITSTEILALTDPNGHLATSTKLIQDARILLAIPELANFVWPTEVPNPFGPSQYVDEAATSDLVQLALCFTFLHELRHAMLIHAGMPYGGKSEEMECDGFAADHLLRGAANFAQRTQWTVDQVLFKRASGIALGCFIMATLSPAGGADHPTAGERLRAVCLNVAVGANDNYWLVLASFLVSLLAFQNQLPASITYSDRRDLAVQLASAL